MEAVTPSTSKKDDEEEYPRFHNMILLGSKPSKSDSDSLEQDYDSEENSDENDSTGENSDENDNSEVAASSRNSEVCKHCNKIYPDKELLLEHLLEIATKYGNTIESIAVDQNTPPDSANTLNSRKKYRSAEIGEEIASKSVEVDQSFLNITSDDAKIDETDLNRNVEEVNTKENKYFYKCRDCHEDFADYNAAHVHKFNKHPKTQQRHLFFKCSVLKSKASVPKNESTIDSNKEEGDKGEIENTQEDTNSSQNNLKRKQSHEEVVNKRLKTNDTHEEGPIVEEMTTNEDNGNEKVAKLFKCPCGLHYTSYKVLQKHFKVCSPVYKVSKQDCSKCGILFPTDSLVDHLCKHHANEKYKFKVVNMTPDIRTHNCEFCHVTFFSKADLNKHIEECKCDSDLRDSIASEECPKPKESRFSIDPTNLKRKYNKRKEVNEPSKTSQKGPTSANVNKRQKQFTLYKCYKCDVHYLKLPSIRYHFEVVNHQMCSKILPCEFCGLNFTYHSMKKHVYLHHTKIKCELKDLRVQIIDESIIWNKYVEPGNDNAEDLTDHDDTNHPTKQKKKAPNGEGKKCSTAERSTPNTQQLSSNYGDKLYKSGLCPVHFMTKRALYKHMTSDHISVEMCTESSTDCTICGHAFGVETLQDHIIVHHLNMKLKAEDFRIVIKDSIKANTDIVNISNNAEVNSKSLNLNSKRGDDNIKKRVIYESYDEHLYKCKNCSVHVMKLNTIYKHFATCNPHVDPVAPDCQICGLKFSSHSMKRHIYIHHKKMKLKRSDFIISHLTKSIKEDTNPTKITEKKTPKTNLQERNHNSKTCRSYKLSSEHKAILDKKSYDKRLYKCVKCSLHFMRLGSLKQHYLCCKPHDKTNKVDCEFCGLKFSFITISIHEYAHHKRMKFTLKDFEIITDQENDAQDTKIGKRKKYVKVSDRDLNTQVKRKRGRPVKRIRGRPRIPLAPINDKLSLNVKHGKGANINVDKTRKPCFKNSNLTKKVIAAINSTSYNNCLYKCHTCSLHFMRKNTLKRHLVDSRHKQHSKGANTAECSECGLSFRMNSLSRHEYVHHMKMKLTLRDLSIILIRRQKRSKTLQSNKAITNLNAQIDLEEIKELEDGRIDKTKSDLSISPKKLKQYNNCLYKCHTCFLHFIGAQTYYKHVAESDHTVLDAKCDVCGLFFSLNSIERHKEIHHTILKLKREDIRIVNQIETSDDKTIQHNNLQISKPSNDNTKEHDIRVKDEVTLENNMQSSRNKIRMALDSIESSTYDINTLRQNISALSKTKKTKIDDDVQKTAVNISLRDMISLEEDVSDNFTETSRQRMETSIIVTEPSKDKVVLPINRRKSTKDHIQTSNVDETPRNTTSLEDNVFSTFFLDEASIASQLNIVHSSTPNPNNKTAKQNTSRVENEIDATNAVSSNNLSFSSAVARKLNLQSTLNTYSKYLYKCEICNLHFNAFASLQAHTKKAIHEPRLTDVCNICNFTFSSRSIKRHKDIHHTQLKLKREDFKIVTDDQDNLLNTKKKGKVSSATETKGVAMTSEREENAIKTLNKMTTDSKYQATLFKCGKCNVCFVKRNIWLKHTFDHVPLQHKEFTECKLCGFQFAIYTLHKHVEKHHEKDFNLEEVLIEEYMNDGTIEIYCAIDRVQSKLISTTTEIVKNTITTSDNVTEG